MPEKDSNQKEDSRAIYWEGWILAFILVPIFANAFVQVLKLAGFLG